MDLLLIITSASGTNIDDLERPWTPCYIMRLGQT